MKLVKWSRLRYPGGNPEDGPARRNPVEGCLYCGDKDAPTYNEDGFCHYCEEDLLQPFSTKEKTK